MNAPNIDSAELNAILPPKKRVKLELLAFLGILCICASVLFYLWLLVLALDATSEMPPLFAIPVRVFCMLIFLALLVIPIATFIAFAIVGVEQWCWEMKPTLETEVKLAWDFAKGLVLFGNPIAYPFTVGFAYKQLIFEISKPKC